MEPVLYSLKPVLRGALILGLSLSVFAQIPAAPDASGVRSDRKAPTPPLTVLPPAVNPPPPFEFRGIRIGDEIKEAQRKFLALNVPSLSPRPGLCGSDGTSRIETCTDHRVAQIYLSTDRRAQGNTYNSYVLALGTKYGRPDKLETKYCPNGVQTGSSGEQLRWLNGDQYMESSEIERAITIGSKALDVEIAEEERLYERN